MEMHERLQYLQKNSGMNKTEFGESLKMSPQQYYKYETGKTEIKSDLIRLLYNNYDVNPLWLTTGRGPITSEHAFNEDSEVWEVTKMALAINMNYLDHLKAYVVSASLESVFGKQSKIISLFENDNILIYLFLKIIRPLNETPPMATTYKTYLTDSIKNYSTNIFYRKKDKSILLKRVKELQEAECKALLSNKNISLKLAEEKLDGITAFIETHVFKIEALQNKIPSFVKTKAR